MPWVDLLFVSLLKVFVISFLMLGACKLALALFRQPVERIRLIQITLATLVVAFLLSQVPLGSRWLPTIDLAVLPANDETGQPIARPVMSKGEVQTSVPAGPGLPGATVVGATTDSPARQPMAGIAEPAVGEPTPTANHSPVSPQNPSSYQSWAGFTLFKLIVVTVFAITALAQAAYLLGGLILTRRLVGTATEKSDGNGLSVLQLMSEVSGESDVPVLFSSRISVPLATGIFRPVIILPASFAETRYEPTLIKHSLAHEWMHIRRKDLLTWQLMGVCQLFLWPQPFYWMLRRELRVSQDQLADQFAADKTNEAETYAQTLLDFSMARQASITGALTMAGSKSNLYRRVEMLLNHEFRIANASRRGVTFGFAGLVAVVGLLVVSLQLTHAKTHDPGSMGNAVGDSSRLQEDENKLDGKAEGEARTHRGVVVDATTGSPVPDVTVIVTRMRSDTWEEIAVTEHQSNDKGEYAFEIPAEQDAQKYLYLMFDLRHGTYAPRHCGSYAYSMIKKNLELGARPWFERLKMQPGAKITGRITDQHGNPVEGAKIHFQSQAPGGDPIRDFSNTSFGKTVSGKDGRFECIATEEGIARLSIIPYEQCMKYVDIGTDRGDLGDFVVEEGISIRGQVLNAVGEKVEGVWVNLTETGTNNEGAYEMKRSSQTDANGEFQTRPLKPGSYVVQVESKATGAIEKKRYANFKDDPTDDVFVRRVIEVTEGSTDQPFVIQAVPHVYVRGQCYNSEGEKARCHLPMVLGSFDGQPTMIRSRSGDESGSFELKVPHGLERARLSFMTNEHSALTIQFEGEPATTETQFEYDRIEEDIVGIKVVRYVAPILQVKVVDEAGEIVKDAGITLRYKDGPEPDTRLIGPKTNVFFEKQENNIHRSSQLAPGIEFEVFASKDGFESERVTRTMKEGTDELITVTLRPNDSDSKDETKMKEKEDQ